MIELFGIVIVILLAVLIIIGHKIVILLESLMEEDLEDFSTEPEIQKQEIPSKTLEFNINSNEEIVGSYQGEPIYKYIESTCGKIFVFESIVTRDKNGMFHTDHPDSNYAVICNCLLYREVE